MNQRDEQRIDDWQIERLVDGELDSEDYKSTLRNLEASDDGWRRCALAFLESQALRQAIPRQLPEKAVEPQSIDGRSVGLDRRAESPPSTWRLVLATAASFLLAFGLGWAVHPLLRGPATSQQIVEDQSATSRDEGPVLQLANSSPEPVDSATQSPRSPVRLVVDDGSGQSREVTLPMQTFDDAMDDWNRVDQLPPEVADLLRAHGHDLHRRQQYIPVPLEDGSQLVIPVEQMRIVPVNRSEYQ